MENSMLLLLQCNHKTAFSCEHHGFSNDSNTYTQQVRRSRSRLVMALSQYSFIFHPSFHVHIKALHQKWVIPSQNILLKIQQGSPHWNVKCRKEQRACDTAQQENNPNEGLRESRVSMMLTLCQSTLIDPTGSRLRPRNASVLRASSILNNTGLRRRGRRKGACTLPFKLIDALFSIFIQCPIRMKLICNILFGHYLYCL